MTTEEFRAMANAAQVTSDLRDEVARLQRRAAELEAEALALRRQVHADANTTAKRQGELMLEAAEQRKRAEEAEARAERRTLRHVKPFQWEVGRLCHGGTLAHWRCDACGAPLCDLHATPGALEHGCPQRPAGRNSGFSLWPPVGSDLQDRHATAIEKARRERLGDVLADIATTCEDKNLAGNGDWKALAQRRMNALNYIHSQASAAYQTVRSSPDAQASGTCGICGRTMNSEGADSLDCGGDCWRCVSKEEGNASTS